MGLTKVGALLQPLKVLRIFHVVSSNEFDQADYNSDEELFAT